MDDIRQPLEPKLASLPDKPGVYLMRDVQGRVIYVGKAVVLRHRVRSYFGETALRDAKTARLVVVIAPGILRCVVSRIRIDILPQVDVAVIQAVDVFGQVDLMPRFTIAAWRIPIVKYLDKGV